MIIQSKHWAQIPWLISHNKTIYSNKVTSIIQDIARKRDEGEQTYFCDAMMVCVCES